MHQLCPGPELDDVLEPYRSVARPAHEERPWVLANMVAGLDGSAAVRGRVGALSDDVDRALFHLLRSLADVVLVGAETVRQERYGPVRVPEELQRRRADDGRAPVPRLVIVTRSLELDPTITCFTGPGPRPLIITCAAAPADRRARFGGIADVVEAGGASVDLGAALGLLHRDGVRTVLTEGGPALLGQFVESGYLDELCLTLSPVMGGDSLPVSVSSATSALTRFRLGHALASDGALFLRYEHEGPAHAA